MPADRARLILVTGASGYVGGRLVPRLLEAGYRVRAATRAPERLRSRPWGTHPGVEAAAADVSDGESLRRAADGTWAAYYLVHSMTAHGRDFAEADRRGARNMAAAAEAAGLSRIVYLGGLGEDHPDLSAHLRSRAEVDQVLRAGTVPVTTLRAAMIIGSGSASFEILRYLVDRLPVMITPRWVSTPVQPIAIRNVLVYLVGVLAQPETAGASYDIGGPEVLTYRRLMDIYADEAGLARPRIIPVPVLTPRLSSYWIHLVTPVPAALAKPLAEGLRNPVVCREFRLRGAIVQDLLDARSAVREAMRELTGGAVETRWSDAAGVAPAEWSAVGDPRWAGGTTYTDRRHVQVDVAPDAVWRRVARIGGRTGWYYADWLWRLRGFLDRLVGGAGLRTRAGGLPVDGGDAVLSAGDALDFWRVAAVEPPDRLLLAAEMRLPGRAWLEFRIRPVGDGRSELQQTATFRPRGLPGILYWYGIYPLHQLVFRGMVRGIARAATAEKSASPR
jgi:uncharacterized protein YbjT (DUF2867 family)